MTVLTLEQEIETSAEVFERLCAAITDLRREIEALTRRAQDGETINDTAITDPLRKLKGLVTDCAKAETYLNDCKNRKAGIARGGHALDLDQARLAIGCKLDRLRRCRPSGGIS